MTPADFDRVFGRGRLRMVTGDHVEVFREASLPGERRRYTKRFLATAAGDFSEWTEREWRILARLVGHGIKPVPDVVRFDRGAADRPALVQTYDAGITVDHWATLLPLERDGTVLRNVFEDCAHWWALARHSLIALDAIHELHLVHLDLKADNVCIPAGALDFDARAPGQLLRPRFDDIALIDFAFSLVSGERLDSALPIAQQADYEYQSPRLLRALECGRHGDLAPTRQLDWRCDLFSLAAMLWRYLPELEGTTTGAWTRPRHARARALVRRLIEAHDAELPATRPHAEFIALATEALAPSELSESLQRGWTLTVDRAGAAAVSPTPITRIALPVPAPTLTPAGIVAAAAEPSAPVAAAVSAPVEPVAPAPAAAAMTVPLVGQPAATPAPDLPMPPPVLAHPAALPDLAAAASSAQATTRESAPTRDATATAKPASGPIEWPAAAKSARVDDASERMAVDPTDVVLRLQARRREREQRVRRLAWAGGLAAVTVVAGAAALWLDPALRALPGARDLHIARAPVPAVTARRDVVLAPTTRSAPAAAATRAAAAAPIAATTLARVEPERSDAERAPGAPAHADDESASSAPSIVAAPTHTAVDAPTPAAVASPTPAPAAPPVAPPKTAPVAPRVAPEVAASTGAKGARNAAANVTSNATANVAPRSGEPPRSRTLAHGRTIEPTPSRANPTRAGHPSMPFPAATHLARSSATAAPRTGATAPSRMAAAAGARRGAGANPWPGNGTTIPWAVAGRGAPRAVLARADAKARRSGDDGALVPVTPAARGADAGTSAIVNVNAAASAARTDDAAMPAPTAPAVVARPALTSDAVPSSTNAPAASRAPVGIATAPAANAAGSAAPSSANPSGDAAPIDYAARAGDLMTNHVPRLAQRAERQVARALFVASRSDNVPGDAEIRSAAAAVGAEGAGALAALPVSARDAQRFGAAARAEYARRGGTPEALSLQVRAFGADPLDAESAGNLAFLLLRQRPAQAEAARQLALHALAAHGSRFPEGRIEDWATFAIASALVGRERDARNAFLVALSLAPNLDRQCRAALDVYAIYGERLRAPVEAMLASASASGRAGGSSFCEWPPHWVTTEASR